MASNSRDQSQPNFALDPRGLRGTASARRWRQTRRRQQGQSILVALVLTLGAATVIWRALQPRAGGFATQRAQNLPLDLTAPAALDGDGNLLATSESGAVWRIGPKGEPTRYGLASKAGAPPLAGADGGVYVPGLDGTLTALSAPGQTLWQRDLGAALATTPALWSAQTTTVLGSGDGNGFVLGLNAGDGQTLWKTLLGGPVGNALTATSDSFLAPTLARGVWRGGLTCLDARSGRVRWSFSATDRSQAGVAAPLFDAANERVYWNNDEGEIVCLDAKTGSVRWRNSLAPDAQSSVMLRATPVLSGENLVVGGNDGILRGLNASDGKVRWTTPLGAPIRALYQEKSAILVATHNEIIRVEASTGAISGRDAGAMAWPTPDQTGAIIVNNNGSWRRVGW